MTTSYIKMEEYTKAEWNDHHFYFSLVLLKAKENNIKSFIDLGSCLGEVSKLMISSIPSLEKIIAIEAIPNNFDFLKQNLKSDKHDITYINKAVYYGEPYVSMGTSLSNIGGFSVHADGIYNNHEQIINNIETITLEEIINGANIDFIKIDVEGAEKNIIENSQAIKKIKLIELEFHDSLAEESMHNQFLKIHLPNHKIIQRCYRNQAGNNVFLELS